MAVDVVYVDGTAEIPNANRDGLSWETAYCGVGAVVGDKGLQWALDTNVVPTNGTLMKVRNTFTVTTVIDIDAAGGTGEDNLFLDIVCSDPDTGNELANGLYTIFTGEGTLTDPLFRYGGSVENVRFWHAHFTDTNQQSGNYGVHLAVDNPRYNFIFNHCNFSRVRSGLSLAGGNNRSIVLQNCEASDCAVYVFSLAPSIYGCVVSHCFLTHAGSSVIEAGRGSMIINNLIIGGDVGIGDGWGTAIMNIVNNTFLGQTDSCIKLVLGNSKTIIYNNLLYIPPGYPNTYAIQRNSGSILYEDYNVTNAQVNGLLTGEHSVNGDVADDDWIKIMYADYRLQPGSGCFNTGKPTRLGGYENIGAWTGRQGAPRRLINV